MAQRWLSTLLLIFNHYWAVVSADQWVKIQSSGSFLKLAKLPDKMDEGLFDNFCHQS